MRAHRRFQIQVLLLSVVFLSVCLMSGFVVITHTCADCANYTIVCDVLADSPLPSWQPDLVPGLAFFFLAAKVLLLAGGQNTENHDLSLVKWKIQMNN
ncbi:MAG: hypothetical protein FWD03_01295 [Defluviitaleaceae bacterium]|nr:hypothetical protein [Defluviitaleaceae bacterium]